MYHRIRTLPESFLNCDFICGFGAKGEKSHSGFGAHRSALD
jgi:hypothetical protein